MKKGLSLFLVVFLFSACTSPFAALNRFRDKDTIIEEMRTEIADLKHSLHSTEVEMRLLEENLENQTDSKVGQLAETLTDLSRKITHLEKTQDKVSADLKNLVVHANQTSHSLAQYRERIKELDHKVEGAHLVHKRVETETPQKYRVQSGDSLQKIARLYHTSVDHLKNLNQLSGDMIFTGQLLKVSDRSNE